MGGRRWRTKENPRTQYNVRGWAPSFLEKTTTDRRTRSQDTRPGGGWQACCGRPPAPGAFSAARTAGWCGCSCSARPSWWRHDGRVRQDPAVNSASTLVARQKHRVVVFVVAVERKPPGGCACRGCLETRRSGHRKERIGCKNRSFRAKHKVMSSQPAKKPANNHPSNQQIF